MSGWFTYLEPEELRGTLYRIGIILTLLCFAWMSAP